MKEHTSNTRTHKITTQTTNTTGKNNLHKTTNKNNTKKKQKKRYTREDLLKHTKTQTPTEQQRNNT